MSAKLIRSLHRTLAGLQGLNDVRPLGWLSGLDVPQTPGRPGDQRLDVERRHVLIVGMAEIDASHLRGVVVIPAVVLFRRHGMGLLNPPGDGLDQLVLELGCACGKGARFGDVVAGELGAGVGFLLAVLAPGEVVERADRVGDAPMRHDAFGIELERLAKALDAFLPIEAVAPVQTQVEPALRFGRGRGDRPGVGSEIEAVHRAAALVVCTDTRSSQLGVSEIFRFLLVG